MGHRIVFPLLQPNGHDPTYALLDELLESQQVVITESSEEGSISAISVLNEAAVDALILDGTELSGARQNRMVNTTIVAGAGMATPIPVSCVEAGRWEYRYRSTGFASTKRTVAAKMRNAKGHMVAARLARDYVPETNQSKVWWMVEDYLQRSRASSPTAALDDAFVHREEAIEEVLAQLHEIDAYGAVVAINGTIIALDLLDHRRNFKKLWQSLLRG